MYFLVQQEDLLMAGETIQKADINGRPVGGTIVQPGGWAPTGTGGNYGDPSQYIVNRQTGQAAMTAQYAAQMANQPKVNITPQKVEADYAALKARVANQGMRQGELDSSGRSSYLISTGSQALSANIASRNASEAMAIHRAGFSDAEGDAIRRDIQRQAAEAQLNVNPNLAKGSLRAQAESYASIQKAAFYAAGNRSEYSGPSGFDVYSKAEQSMPKDRYNALTSMAGVQRNAIVNSDGSRLINIGKTPDSFLVVDNKAVKAKDIYGDSLYVKIGGNVNEIGTVFTPTSFTTDQKQLIANLKNLQGKGDFSKAVLSGSKLEKAPNLDYLVGKAPYSDVKTPQIVPNQPGFVEGVGKFFENSLKPVSQPVEQIIRPFKEGIGAGIKAGTDTGASLKNALVGKVESLPYGRDIVTVGKVVKDYSIVGIKAQTESGLKMAMAPPGLQPIAGADSFVERGSKVVPEVNVFKPVTEFVAAPYNLGMGVVGEITGKEKRSVFEIQNTLTPAKKLQLRGIETSQAIVNAFNPVTQAYIKKYPEYKNVQPTYLASKADETFKSSLNAKNPLEQWVYNESKAGGEFIGGIFAFPLQVGSTLPQTYSVLKQKPIEALGQSTKMLLPVNENNQFDPLKGTFSEQIQSLGANPVTYIAGAFVASPIKGKYVKIPLERGGYGRVVGLELKPPVTFLEGKNAFLGGVAKSGSDIGFVKGSTGVTKFFERQPVSTHFSPNIGDIHVVGGLDKTNNLDYLLTGENKRQVDNLVISGKITPGEARYSKIDLKYDFTDTGAGDIVSTIPDLKIRGGMESSGAWRKTGTIERSAMFDITTGREIIPDVTFGTAATPRSTGSIFVPRGENPRNVLVTHSHGIGEDILFSGTDIKKATQVRTKLMAVESPQFSSYIEIGDNFGKNAKDIGNQYDLNYARKKEQIFKTNLDNLIQKQGRATTGDILYLEKVSHAMASVDALKSITGDGIRTNIFDSSGRSIINDPHAIIQSLSPNKEIFRTEPSFIGRAKNMGINAKDRIQSTVQDAFSRNPFESIGVKAKNKIQSTIQDTTFKNPFKSIENIFTPEKPITKITGKSIISNPVLEKATPTYSFASGLPEKMSFPQKAVEFGRSGGMNEVAGVFDSSQFYPDAIKVTNSMEHHVDYRTRIPKREQFDKTQFHTHTGIKQTGLLSGPSELDVATWYRGGDKFGNYAILPKDESGKIAYVFNTQGIKENIPSKKILQNEYKSMISSGTEKTNAYISDMGLENIRGEYINRGINFDTNIVKKSQREQIRVDAFKEMTGKYGGEFGVYDLNTGMRLESRRRSNWKENADGRFIYRDFGKYETPKYTDDGFIYPTIKEMEILRQPSSIDLENGLIQEIAPMENTKIKRFSTVNFPKTRFEDSIEYVRKKHQPKIFSVNNQMLDFHTHPFETVSVYSFGEILQKSPDTELYPRSILNIVPSSTDLAAWKGLEGSGRIGAIQSENIAWMTAFKPRGKEFPYYPLNVAEKSTIRKKLSTTLPDFYEKNSNKQINNYFKNITSPITNIPAYKHANKGIDIHFETLNQARDIYGFDYGIFKIENYQNPTKAKINYYKDDYTKLTEQSLSTDLYYFDKFDYFEDRPKQSFMPASQRSLFRTSSIPYVENPEAFTQLQTAKEIPIALRQDPRIFTATDKTKRQLNLFSDRHTQSLENRPREAGSGFIRDIGKGIELRYFPEVNNEVLLARKYAESNQFKQGGLGDAYTFNALDDSKQKIIAFSGDKVVGAVSFDRYKHGETRFDIDWLGVTQEGQKQGIGKNLVLFAKDIVKEQGAKRIRLQPKSDAVGFYNRLGFVEVGKINPVTNAPHYMDLNLESRRIKQYQPESKDIFGVQSYLHGKTMKHGTLGSGLEDATLAAFDSMNPRLVAFEGETPVGALSFEQNPLTRDTIRVNWVGAVKPGRGVGSDLFAGLEQTIRKKGDVKYIELTAAQSAVPFYEKYGFVKTEDVRTPNMILRLPEEGTVFGNRDISLESTRRKDYFDILGDINADARKINALQSRIKKVPGILDTKLSERNQLILGGYLSPESAYTQNILRKRNFEQIAPKNTLNEIYGLDNLISENTIPNELIGYKVYSGRRIDYGNAMLKNTKIGDVVRDPRFQSFSFNPQTAMFHTGKSQFGDGWMQRPSGRRVLWEHVIGENETGIHLGGVKNPEMEIIYPRNKPWEVVGRRDVETRYQVMRGKHPIYVRGLTSVFTLDDVDKTIIGKKITPDYSGFSNYFDQSLNLESTRTIRKVPQSSDELINIRDFFGKKFQEEKSLTKMQGISVANRAARDKLPLLVAYDENTPVGALSFGVKQNYDNVLKVESLGVLEPKQGIGTDLMTGLFDVARKRGFKEVELDSLKSAVPFYRKLGFEEYFTPSGNEMITTRMRRSVPDEANPFGFRDIELNLESTRTKLAEKLNYYKFRSGIKEFELARTFNPEERAAHKALYKMSGLFETMPEELIQTRLPDFSQIRSLRNANPQKIENAIRNNPAVIFGSTNALFIREKPIRRQVNDLEVIDMINTRESSMKIANDLAEAWGGKKSVFFTEDTVRGQYPTIHIKDRFTGEDLASVVRNEYPMKFEIDKSGNLRYDINVHHPKFKGTDEFPISQVPQSPKEIFSIGGLFIEDPRIQMKRKIEAMSKPSTQGQFGARSHRISKDLFDIGTDMQYWLNQSEAMYKKTGDKKFKLFNDEITKEWNTVLSNPRMQSEWTTAQNQFGVNHAFHPQDIAVRWDRLDAQSGKLLTREETKQAKAALAANPVKLARKERFENVGGIAAGAFVLPIAGYALFAPMFEKDKDKRKKPQEEFRYFKGTPVLGDIEEFGATFGKEVEKVSPGFRGSVSDYLGGVVSSEYFGKPMATAGLFTAEEHEMTKRGSELNTLLDRNIKSGNLIEDKNGNLVWTNLNDTELSTYETKSSKYNKEQDAFTKKWASKISNNMFTGTESEFNQYQSEFGVIDRDFNDLMGYQNKLLRSGKLTKGNDGSFIVNAPKSKEQLQYETMQTQYDMFSKKHEQTRSSIFKEGFDPNSLVTSPSFYFGEAFIKGYTENPIVQTLAGPSEAGLTPQSIRHGLFLKVPYTVASVFQGVTGVEYAAKTIAKDPRMYVATAGLGLGMFAEYALTKPGEFIGASIGLGPAKGPVGKATGLINEKVYVYSKNTEPLPIQLGGRTMDLLFGRETITATRTTAYPYLFGKMKGHPIETTEGTTTHGVDIIHAYVDKGNVHQSAEYTFANWKKTGKSLPAAIGENVLSKIFRPRIHVMENVPVAQSVKTRIPEIDAAIRSKGNFMDMYKDILAEAQTEATKTKKPVAVPSPKMASYGELHTGPLEAEVALVLPKGGLKLPSRWTGMSKFEGFTTRGGGLIRKMSFDPSIKPSSSLTPFIVKNAKFNIKEKQAAFEQMQTNDVIRNYQEQFQGALSFKEFDTALHGPSHSVGGVENNLFQMKTHNPKRFVGISDSVIRASARLHDLGKPGIAGETEPIKHAEIVKRAIQSGQLDFIPEIQALNPQERMIVANAISQHTQIRPGIFSASGLKTRFVWKPTDYEKAFATADRLDLTRFGTKPNPKYMWAFEGFPETKRQSLRVKASNLLRAGGFDIAMKENLIEAGIADSIADLFRTKPTQQKSNYEPVGFKQISSKNIRYEQEKMKKSIEQKSPKYMEKKNIFDYESMVGNKKSSYSEKKTGKTTSTKYPYKNEYYNFEKRFSSPKYDKKPKYAKEDQLNYFEPFAYESKSEYPSMIDYTRYPKVNKYEIYPKYPKTPEYPKYPKKPEYPKYPKTPEYPKYPKNPDYPKYPKNPDYPKTPEYPKQPEYPKTPKYPKYPKNPDYPKYPKNPEYPRYPRIPNYPRTTRYPGKETYTERTPYPRNPYGYGQQPKTPNRGNNEGSLPGGGGHKSDFYSYLEMAPVWTTRQMSLGLPGQMYFAGLPKTNIKTKKGLKKTINKNGMKKLVGGSSQQKSPRNRRK